MKAWQSCGHGCQTSKATHTRSGRGGGALPRMSNPVSDTDSPLHAGWHRRGYLPHFDAPDAEHAVTYRLADAFPLDALERMRQEHAAFPDGERGRRLRGAIERFADSGTGACLLTQQACATIVCDNWRRFDGVRHDLLNWVVMPNHVHLMIRVIAGYPLSGIVNSWKSYSASRINRLLKRSGPVWMADYWDRFIRDAGHAQACTRAG